MFNSIRLILLSFLVCTYTSLYSYSYYNNYHYKLGDYNFGVSAKQLSMGGVIGLNENNGGNLLYNPSALTLNNEIRAGFSGELGAVSEIVNTIDTSQSSDELFDNSYNVWDYGNFGMVFPVTKQLFIGAGVYKYLDFNYKNKHIRYYYDTSSDEYLRHSAVTLDYKGDIKKIPVGIAYDFMDILSIGVSYNMIKGEQELLSKNNVYTNRNNYYYLQKSKYSGGNINIGAYMNIGRYITVGGYYETPPKLDIKDSVKLGFDGTNFSYIGTVDRRIEYPGIIGVNLLFKANDQYNSTVCIDVLMKKFKKISQKMNAHQGEIFNNGSSIAENLKSITNSYSGSDKYPELHDVVEIYMGAEHNFRLNRKTTFPIRYGFSYQPSPYERSVTMVAISLGTGLYSRLGLKFKGGIDFGYLYSIRETIDYASGVYPPLTSNDTSSLRKIRESLSIFMISVFLHY